ncbi:MAG: retropepsin-like aspartic protease [Bacteroidota bacterium]
MSRPFSLTRALLALATASILTGCTGTASAPPAPAPIASLPPIPSPSPHEQIARYEAVDLDAFRDPTPASTSSLYGGLRALIYGDAATAEARLNEAVSTIPDSLRPFVYDRLAALKARQFEWREALRYETLRAEAAGESFDPTTSKWSVFAARPQPTAEVDGDAATVSFDGYRIDGSVEGPVGARDARFFIDTGAPVTLLSRALADELGLALDSTAGGAVSIPAIGINGAAVLRTTLDRVTVGGVTFRNLPADVLDTERSIADGADLFLGFDAFRGLLGGIRFGFADSTFTMYASGSAPDRDLAPNLLLESGYAFHAYRAGGQPFTGLVDTGSPFSYVYADWWTPPEDATPRPVTHRGRLADTEYEFTLDYYDFRATLAGAPFDALSLGLSTRGQPGDPFRVMSLLGTGLFEDGALLLDFDRRVLAFER